MNSTPLYAIPSRILQRSTINLCIRLSLSRFSMFFLLICATIVSSSASKPRDGAFVPVLPPSLSISSHGGREETSILAIPHSHGRNNLHRSNLSRGNNVYAGWNNGLARERGKQRENQPFYPSSSNTPSQAVFFSQFSSERAMSTLSGIEDLIFSAQNTASSLANTVVSTGATTSPVPGGTTGVAASSLRSILVLYTAGLWTSFSPCSLGLLPLTVSYISTAAGERRDKLTLLPTLAFAAGLAVVFTSLGVSASLLGGVFGAGGGETDGGDGLGGLILAACSSCVSIAMGLQLLELIRIPLPSLDFKLRANLATVGGENSDSLFDENGGLVLDNLNDNKGKGSDDGQPDSTEGTGEGAALIRTFLLGGTSALVASPCATPVLASLLAYVASSPDNPWRGALLMLAYTLGYSTPLMAIGATGGQALVNLQRATRNGGDGNMSWLGQWVTPLTGAVLITFGMNGFLVALLGDPSLAGLAPIIE